jgi:hypothetical protein
VSARNLWARTLTIAGYIAMLIGALDPLEGSVLILPGSGLVALGTFLSRNELRVIAYRMTVFLLIAVGVGSLWWLSSVGGFGGPGERSIWWGLLVLPYLIGWSMGIWGPGSPRWVLALGIMAGVFYLAITPLILSRGHEPIQGVIVTVIALLGLLTIVGCIVRWRKRPIRVAQQHAPAGATRRR